MDEKIAGKISKWLVIVLAFIVILAASIYAYNKLNEIKVASIESIVPDGSVYYIYSYNLNKKIKDFQASQFFQQLSSNYAYKKYIAPKIETSRQKIPFLADLFVKDAALAVFSLGNNRGTAKRNPVDFGDFLFFARIDGQKHIKIKKSLADFYLMLTPKGEIKQNKYKGVTVAIYKLPKMEMTVNYAFLSDILVISNSSLMIQKSIDLFKSKSHHGSLRNNSSFADFKSRIKADPLLWGYENPRRYYEELLQEYAYNSLKGDRQRENEGLASFMKVKPFADFMNIFEGVVFYLDYDELKSGFVFKSYHLFNKTGDSDIMDIILYNKQVDKNSFYLVPRDIIAYYGGNQDLLKLWKVMRKFSAGAEEIMKAQWKSDPRYLARKDSVNNFSFENSIKGLETFLGTNIENDLLAVAGNNFGMAFVRLEDIDMPVGQKQNFSFIFPEFYWFLELKDSQKMSETMAKMAQHITEQVNQFFQKQDEIMAKYAASKNKDINPQTVPPTAEKKEHLKLKTEEYSGTNIYSIDITDFPVDSIRPNYCILDKYLIFSLSPLLTKKVVDTYKNKQDSFSSGSYFESANNNIPADYSNILYVYFNKMINDIQETKFYSKLQKGLSGDKKSVVSKVQLDSILSVLSNFNTFTYTNRLSDQRTIESTCYIGVKGL